MTPAAIPTSPAPSTDTLLLADLAPNRVTTILGLTAAQGEDEASGLLQRLAELGFMAGETVSVLRRGPGGREPIAVQVGDTVFALRRHEARCIQVKVPA
ncbi:FeoA family protein [Polaromonas sp. SM01]|uniref:FeoA family protein n=1 Tax=Polaromonas sp. SM01 TaxID=3085630 RepID=UPI002980EBB6|nr:FeoA family protein [Polaromonas sp. SM01]MDW5441947.1 FeoA family protein [Polaromonas sp. SM01]